MSKIGALLALCLLLSGCHAGDAGDGGSGDARSSLGKEFLVYYGSGGVPPNTAFGGALTFTNWSPYILGMGLIFRQSDTWPGALDALSVIVLVFPGARTGGAGLAPAQERDLRGWLARGGTLLLLSDVDVDDPGNGIDYRAGNAATDGLLQHLGVPIRVGTDVILAGSYQLPLDGGHPLGRDVGNLLCNGRNTLHYPAGSAVERVDTLNKDPEAAVLLSFPVGPGRVVVIGDATCLDYFENQPGSRRINTFLRNLAR